MEYEIIKTRTHDESYNCKKQETFHHEIASDHFSANVKYLKDAQKTELETFLESMMQKEMEMETLKNLKNAERNDD